MTSSRHPSVEEKLQWFSSDHLSGRPALIVQLFEATVNDLLLEVGDGPQLTIALQKLIEAKDAAVRQVVSDMKQGK